MGTGLVEGSVPPELRDRVMAAGIDELTRWGIERFSLGALAARHGIDESEIVKYWGDGQHLALDVLLRWDGTQSVTPDTGALRSDLKALSLVVASYVNTALGRSLLRALVMEDHMLYSDDTRLTFWKVRLGTLRTIFDRAAERGELRDGINLVAAVQLLVAPINVRALYTAEPVDEEYCTDVADLVWRAVKR
ncbi:TetR/AcrR family transcriptional regulator C-terminal ligand-binding domain-containing protein [Mycolicibacterium komossense]|uniref:TetR/AcrR family transcriptional regulator C-terminal ligand-binding domain-containing protein n=2 Tax=Mycolicibacterium komossense TaxID=1779 RepID=A0ABT3C9W3_9MYCO|nr:TetR/AcrR family transcriptional regulator C-terminal ligand-binding domain-containing protein [Mycolicibacterium komossense]